MERELAVRLRTEELIAGFGDLGIEEAIGALTDVETMAGALAGAGIVAPDVASALVADTVDALVARGASWVEPRAVDLDVRRLYDLAAGAPRPRLRKVVPVASGPITSVDLWDDRAEARVVAADGSVLPSLHLAAVLPGDRHLELRDGGGGTIAVDLGTGRAASEGGTTGRVDAAGYLACVEVHAVAAARRDPSVATLNALRRRLVAAGDVLGDPGSARRFDAAVADLVPERPDSPSLIEVVPVAVRAPFGWLLSVERWTDHWRAVVRAEGRGTWTASDDAGNAYGGDGRDGDVVRFDPALPPTWSWVSVQRLEADGTSVELDVVRR